MFTFLNAKQETLQVTTKNNDEISGRFIGTYMEHIHLLVNNKIVHIHCQRIRSVKKKGSVFSYDCTENTTTPDILFLPKFNPMTGKIVQTIPGFFTPPPSPKTNIETKQDGHTQNISKTNKKTYITKEKILELLDKEIRNKIEKEVTRQLALKPNQQKFKNKKISPKKHL